MAITFTKKPEAENISWQLLLRSGKYKLAATIKKGKTSTWTDKKVKKGKKYRYYVRAYVKEPNGIVKGKYKASVAVTRK